MINQKELVVLKKNDSVDHFLIIKKCEIRLTKSNKQYLCLDLGDKSLTVSANIWENFEKIFNVIKAGDVIKVSGKMDDYQGTPQIRVTALRPLKDDEKVSSTDFLAHSKRDFSVMKSEFLNRIEQISDLNLRTLMKLIFNDTNFEKFSTAPAGKSWHHSYIHGLIEHTLEIMKICDLMSDIHSEINRDLLICGAMMHDFGKTEELSFSSAFDYTDKGKLLGHIVISAMVINEESKKIPAFPEDLKNCLMHLVLSHQGKLEYASPVVPKTLEAITLYQADELSAKVNAYKNVLNSQQNKNGKWTRFISLVATDLYDHGITPETEEDVKKTLFD